MIKQKMKLSAAFLMILSIVNNKLVFCHKPFVHHSSSNEPEEIDGNNNFAVVHDDNVDGHLNVSTVWPPPGPSVTIEGIYS
jgi:hypothetical protein